MSKILVVGEHWGNTSGFAALHKYIVSAICDSKLFDEVTSLAILGRSGVGAPSDFVRTDVILINSVDYEQTNTNQFGRDSMVKFLLSNKDYTHVLCLGDPWYYEGIPFIKAIVGSKTSFHLYCPIEGSNLPTMVQQEVGNLGYPDPRSTNIKKILNSFDQIIPYSHQGKTVIEQLCNTSVTEPIYHWIQKPHDQITAIPTLEPVLANKKVIGFIGRNVHRKGVDLLFELAERLPDDYVILAHVPKIDPYGWNFNLIQHYYPITTTNKILFTEDYIPGLFTRVVGNNILRDVKNGLAQDQMEWLYSKMDLFINLSRAEGFGYPIIEALVRNIPTMVSGFAGPLEIMQAISTPEMAIEPLDIREMYPVGVWYQMRTPNIQAFADNIQLFFNDNDRRRSLTNRQVTQAKQIFLEETSEHRKLLPSLLLKLQPALFSNEYKAIMIDSYLDKCGISTYTSNLIGNEYPRRIKEARLQMLLSSLKYVKNEVIHIQYEPALWEKNLLDVIKLLHEQNNKIVITFHTFVKEFIEDVAKYTDWFIFHSLVAEQTDIIQNLILSYPHLRYTIRTHAIPEYNISQLDRLTTRKELGFTDSHIVVLLNGFILSYKRIAEQAASVIEFIRNNPDKYRLLIVGSQHEKDYLNNGKKILDSIIAYAQSRNVHQYVKIIYEFLPADLMALYLSVADYGLLYHNSGSVGSQSGSVREILAAGVIPIVTKSKSQHMHDDIIEAKAALAIQAKDLEPLGPNQFAAGAMRVLEELLKNTDNHDILVRNMKEYCSEYSFSKFRKFHHTVYKTLREEIGEPS